LSFLEDSTGELLTRCRKVCKRTGWYVPIWESTKSDDSRMDQLVGNCISDSLIPVLLAVLSLNLKFGRYLEDSTGELRGRVKYIGGPNRGAIGT